MVAAKMDDDVPIEHKMVTRSIASAQGQVEGRNFEIRKNVLKYDDVLNTQRSVIYGERRRVLEGENLAEQVRLFLNDVIEGYVSAATAEGFAEDWDLDQLWTACKVLFPVSITIEEVEQAAGGRQGLTADILRDELTSDAHHALDERERQLGSPTMREVERRVVLSVLDRKWREHLYEMDYLQEGIGLRAMAQRDPVVEYSREGYSMFTAMMDSIKEESIGFLFSVEVEAAPPMELGEGIVVPQTPAIQGVGERPQQRLHYSAPTAEGDVEERDDGDASAQATASEGSRQERRSAARKAKQNKRRR